MTDKLVAVIDKNATEDIRVTLTEFRGYRLCSMRVFYDAGARDMRPGKSGLNVRVEQLPEIIEALQQAAREAGV